MATRLKTVAFPLPPLASIVDATVTNFAQITVDLPESSKSFKKVWVEATAMDLITATGGTIGESRLGVSVNGAAYTTVTQANPLTNSGENMAPHICADFTAHFTTNFTGSSHTFDLQIYLDQTTGTTLNFANGTAILWVTYEYDDTSTTQVLNAWIPITSTAGALPTAKGAAQDTIPAIDTFLGYGLLSYKHMMLIMDGNESSAAGLTAFTVTAQVDATSEQVGASHEAALGSDRYVKEHFNLMSAGSCIFTTNASHSFYSWISSGGTGKMHHASFYILVVFTFDATSANDGNISLLLPQEFEAPMGGTTADDYQDGSVELWIQEPATITIQKSAFRWHWTQVGSTPAYFRVGSQAFAQITDVATALCGGNCVQRTIDDVVTLARGRNKLVSDVYSPDTTDKGWAVSGVWVVNYKCGKPAGGWGEANHTVIWPIILYGDSGTEYKVTATSLQLPEADYFINALGIKADIMSYTNAMSSLSIFVERLSAEGGIKWEKVYGNPIHDDAETGYRQFYGNMRSLFRRWLGDPDESRMDIETDRRWRFVSGQNVNVFSQIFYSLTYHAIKKTVSGTITGSGGGTVNVYLHRADNNTNQAGEKLKATSRVGNGAYSFDWFDDTEEVYTSAFEDGTHVGRSDNDIAT